MHSNPPSPTTNSDKYSEPPYYQHLLFSPVGQDREKYKPENYRTLLRKHLGDHSRSAKPIRRNTAACVTSEQSDPCGGDSIAAAPPGTTGGEHADLQHANSMHFNGDDNSGGAI